MRQILITYFLVFCCLLCNAQSAFFYLGKQYADDGNYEEAIRLTKLSLGQDSISLDKLYLFSDYDVLCDYYSRISEPDSCLHYANLAKEISNHVEGLERKTVLGLLSTSLSRAGFHEQAIDYRIQIFDIIESIYGNLSPRLVNEYSMLSWFCQNAGDNLRAVEYAKKEEELAYQTRNIIDEFPNRRSYEESFSSLLSVIQQCDEPIAGIQYLLNRINIHRDAIDQDNWRYALNSIWAISRDNDFIEGCLAVYKERALYGDYKEQLTNLININVEDINIKNDVHAAEYAQALYNIAFNDDLTNYFSEEEIEHLLWLLPRYYAKIGCVRESFEMAKRNYEWRSKNNKELFFSDVMVLISGSALPDEAAFAVEFGENILNSHRYDNDMDALQMIYQNLAGAYLHIGNNDRALLYIDKIGDTDDYQTLNAKAGVYMQSGDMKSLLPLAIKLNDYKDIPEENRANVLMMLMMSARDSRNESIITKYAPEYVNTYREHLLSNIPLMSEEEQAKYIRKLAFSNILSFDYFVGIDGDNCLEWSAAKEAYNYSLLKKGVLLTSQNEFRNVIKCSSDSLIQSQWKILQDSDTGFSLHGEIFKRNLINYASQRSSYLKKLSYTWEDVKGALEDDEAAIEFILCYNFDDFTNKQCNPIYLALIVRKDSDEPLTIVLSPVLNISQLHPNELFSDDNMLLYNLLWHPLESHLHGIKRIYFSPVENLNSVPFEYASLGASRICDKWEMIRVSSTREIIDKPINERKGHAILYGGLQYDLEKDELIAYSRNGEYHSAISSRAIFDDNLRYKVKYLPGSLLEVTDIANLFAETPNVLTDGLGTEESFKSLTGSSYDIIHLATHGFFWSESVADKQDNIDFLHDEHYLTLSKEDNAMLRSGLVFSGASIFLDGGDLPKDVDDGILTASELSAINLGDVDLVVMSACDSGLGEISSEGVFGLQRGFKLAGAKSLLMSLWNVDDHATYMLMTEFYKQYLSGKTKRQSLYLAQSILRESEEFSSPYFWASFILLD